MTSFGYGRRQCLGQTLTQDELLVACGGLLWGFNMAKKVDPVTGLEIDIPLSQSNSLLIIKPDPFEMAFHPRSEKRREEIRRNWQNASDSDRELRDEFARLASAKREEAMGWPRLTNVKGTW